MALLPHHLAVAVPLRAADNAAVAEGTANRLEELAMGQVATDRVVMTQAEMGLETILGRTLLELARAEEKGSEERADGRQGETPRCAMGLVIMTPTIMSRQGDQVVGWTRPCLRSSVG